ncbi:3'-5' exonuclease [Nocardia carnea]|uniref:3'-5' exonuclease n=1 Tax=Nocardia carnea TaxID=37328 RepID=UPI002453CDBD|nr:3'-5' exonuclease [Nocardia carnea]
MIVPKALRGRDFAVVDVEGNGQTPPEIIEIAILPVSGDDVVVDQMRQWLIKPDKPITPIVTRKVHGIKNSDVADCPAWAEVSDVIESVLAERILVAHNAPLERRVVGDHLPGWAPPMVLDTIKLAKAVWPGLPGYSLEKLVVHAQLDTTAVGGHGHHRAGWDTWADWQLLVRLVEDSGLGWDELVQAAAPAEFVPPREPEGRLW